MHKNLLKKIYMHKNCNINENGISALGGNPTFIPLCSPIYVKRKKLKLEVVDYQLQYF
jgi:hypothetical protein